MCRYAERLMQQSEPDGGVQNLELYPANLFVTQGPFGCRQEERVRVITGHVDIKFNV